MFEQKKHSPQLAAIDQVIRSPNRTSFPNRSRIEPLDSTTCPTISCPRIVGHSQLLRPVNVCRSLPQIVLNVTSTSNSPSTSTGLRPVLVLALDAVVRDVREAVLEVVK